MRAQLAVSVLALAISTAASATAITFNNATGSYSSGTGITANVTASGGSLYYNSASILSGSGIGVKGALELLSGPLTNGESLTVTFNQAVNLNSISFAAWEGGIDQVTMSYTSGSQTFSNTFNTNMIDTFSTGGILLNSFSITPSGSLALTTSTYLNSLDVTPAVPVPAAAWLFGSGLLGLAGFGRKRNS